MRGIWWLQIRTNGLLGTCFTGEFYAGPLPSCQRVLQLQCHIVTAAIFAPCYSNTQDWETKRGLTPLKGWFNTFMLELSCCLGFQI